MRVNVVSLVSRPEVAGPLVGLVPDQPPDPVQAVALVDVQLSVTADPEETEGALLVRVSVGAVGVGATLIAYVPAFIAPVGCAMKFTK